MDVTLTQRWREMNLTKTVVPEKCYQLIKEATANYDTGKLYVHFKKKNKLQSGVIYFARGRLCGAKFGRLVGEQALLSLCGQDISSAIFMKVALSDVELHAAMPAVVELMTVLVCRQEDNRCMEQAHILFESVQSKLECLMGAKGARHAGYIAVKHPPHRDARDFVEHCLQLASNHVGQELAHKALAPVCHDLLEKAG